MVEALPFTGYPPTRAPMTSRKWCAVDAEGDVGNRGLIGVSIWSDVYQEWLTDRDSIVEALTHHAQRGYTFVTHNASYDVPVIWEQLELRPQYTYYNDRLHHASWPYRPNKPAAQIWDSWELAGHISLEELGRAINLPKYPTPQKLKGVDPDRYTWQCELHKEWECTECYALRDAEIVHTFMVSFTGTLAAWGVKPKARLASIAMDVWQEFDNPGVFGLSDFRNRELARRAYYGGRTECFMYGSVPFPSVSDVQSMYPAMMLATPMPDPHSLVYVQDIRPDQLPLQCEGVAHVDISVPSMHVPPLPYYSKGIRCYPVGRLVSCWTLLELRYAVALGCRINRVIAAAYTDRVLHPFDRFIGVLWEMREAYKATDDPRQLFAKLLMNNLYGRLGTRDRPVREILKPAPPKYRSDKQKFEPVHYHTETGLWLGYVKEMGLGHDKSNVLWAAQITSAARVHLHKFMLLQGIDLAYTDTDSIFSAKVIEGTGKGLGQLKAEGEYQRAILVQSKLYALQNLQGEWQAHAKGVARDAALTMIGHGVATFSRAIKPREALRRGIPAGSWVDLTRDRQQVVLPRQPRDIYALSDPYGYTETDPLVCGPLIDYPQSHFAA